MLIKWDSDEIQTFLVDASNMPCGRADRVVFPESTEEVAAVLSSAARDRKPVTVSGGGTGIVGGRVPFGGIVLATDRLNRIQKIVRQENGGWAVAEAGVRLADFQRAVAEQGLIYPPDPTEWSCYLGGTIATNASGARSFKYGPTRSFVRRLKIAFSTGEVLNLPRGQVHAGSSGLLRIPISNERSIEALLPSYTMPATRKHASGYYVEPGMDAIDLFIGSEGTLGVITELEVALLPKPEGLLSGIIFFKTEENLLAFVRAARYASLENRRGSQKGGIDARALEYFDFRSLELLRKRYTLVPDLAVGAIFFEQETTELTEDHLQTEWLDLLERHKALMDDSWFATAEREQQEMREFRHALPLLVNEWLAHHGQRKISTDMAVPDSEFAAMLRFYQETLSATDLHYVIFGHIGDNHVHVNILPRNAAEADAARAIYLSFVKRAVTVGGTISAEHGIGKLKREYLRHLYGEQHLRQMAALKRAFDPHCILGRGNIFSEDYL